MKLRTVAWSSAFVMLALTSTAFGAEERPYAGESLGSTEWLILVAPAVLLILFLAVIIKKSGTLRYGSYLTKADEQLNRYAEYLDHAVEHMATLERKTDRMIELLESIDRKLGERA